MSDDTPTQRYPEGFPPPGGQPPGGRQGGEAGEPAAPTGPTQPLEPQGSPLADAPTERFPAAGTQPPAAEVPPGVTVPPAGTVPPDAATASGDDGKRRQRGVIVGLAIAAGVLLLALIGLLIWLAVSSGSPTVTPTDSPTPSETPSESPEPSPTPSETETETPPPPPPPPPADAITSYTASTDQVDCTASGGAAIPVTFSWAATGTMLWFGVGTDDAHTDPVDDFPLNYTMDFDYQCGQPGQQQRYTITVERTDGTFESKTLIIREV